jgi:hypothetical protein
MTRVDSVYAARALARTAQHRGLHPRSDAAQSPNVAGAAAGLNAALDTILESLAAQKTISLGCRWDVMKNVDLKVQYDHINLGAGSAGTLINVQPDFQRGSTVNVASIAIDFVW